MRFSPDSVKISWEFFEGARPVVLYANDNATQTTEDNIDFLSNGFKIRTTGGENNGSGDVYAFWAFAEQPFVNSNGVPGNAR